VLAGEVDDQLAERVDLDEMIRKADEAKAKVSGILV